jgi:TonB family protein
MSKPYYEGGIKAMRTLIREHMTYPQEALENKVEGSVKIKYDIDYKGKVFKTKVIKSLGHGCDEEAERLVKMFEFKVERTRKMKVIFHKNIQINFKLPKVKKVKKTVSPKQNVSLQYQVIHEKKPADKKSDKGTYTYTISF